MLFKYCSHFTTEYVSVEFKIFFYFTAEEKPVEVEEKESKESTPESEPCDSPRSSIEDEKIEDVSLFNNYFTYIRTMRFTQK